MIMVEKCMVIKNIVTVIRDMIIVSRAMEKASKVKDMRTISMAVMDIKVTDMVKINVNQEAANNLKTTALCFIRYSHA